jgi:small-conductance mechanosensitive channel
MNAIANLYDPAYHDGVIAAVILLGTILVALLIQRALFGFLERRYSTQSDGIVTALLRRASGPAGFVFPLVAALIAIPNLTFPPDVDGVRVKLTAIATVIAVAWTIIASIGLYADLVKRKYKLDVEDNLLARQVETRIDILGRTAVTIVILVACALAAFEFPAVRVLGTTLLASAGVAGIVLGIAARPLFENLIAGVQLALAQPIRIDDVVIVEGEYGHVEQIAATYVVVRIWDQRRMILPLTYFIEKPFQNWTRTGSALLGTVFLYVDYSISVEAVREQLPKILEGEKLWDGAVAGLQVTDAKESTVELRILVSARNSSDLFDLRCNVREKMVAFLSANHPTALPQARQVAITSPSPNPPPAKS